MTTLDRLTRLWQDQTHDTMAHTSAVDQVRMQVEMSHQARRQDALVDLQVTGEYDPPDPDDLMGRMNYNNLIIGDEALRLFAEETEREQQQEPQTPTPGPPGRQNGNKWLPLALAAGLLGSGAIGTGAGLLWSHLTEQTNVNTPYPDPYVWQFIDDGRSTD